MNKINSVFIDLDGTLVQSESNDLDRETISVLRSLTKQGIDIIINTRRNLAGCKKLMKKLSFIKYWITSSSGFLYFNHLDHKLVLREIPKDIISREVKEFNYCQVEFSDGSGLACKIGQLDNQLEDLIHRVNANNGYQILDNRDRFLELIKDKSIVNLYKDGVNIYNTSKLFGAERLISIASLFLKSGDIVVLDDSDSDLSLVYTTYAPKENSITNDKVNITEYNQKDFVKSILKEIV